MKRFFAGALLLTLPFAGAIAEKAYADTSAETSQEEPEAKDSAQTLESLEVTAYKFGVDSLSVPVYSTTIDKKQIEESSASLISEVLQKKGNVRFMSYTGNDSEGSLSMRGFGENSQTRILVLVDGLKYNPADMSGINWTQIPLSSVESIEIMRGAQSAMYGGNAEAGVIKITTAKESEGVEAFARGIYGSYGLYSAYASARGRFGNAFMGANVSTYNSDGYRAFSKSWSNSASASAGYDVNENLRFILKGDYAESFTQYPNPLDWETFQNDPRSATSSTDYKNKAGVYTANLNSQSSYGKADATFGINFRDRTIDALTQNNQWTYTFAPRYEFTRFEYVKIFTGFDVDFSNIDYSKDRRFSTGKVVNTAYADVNRFDLAYYICGQYEATESLTFNLAGRAEGSYTSADSTEYAWILPQLPPLLNSQYSQNQWVYGLAATAGVSYKLDETSSLYARFDQIYHYPTVDEIASYQGYGTNTFTFNKDLKPEIGQNYEIGYKLESENFRLNAGAFVTYIQNEIQWDDALKKNVNISPTIRYGLDFDASYESKYWGASVAATLVDAQFASGKFSGNSVPLVAPLNLSATLSAKPIEYVTILGRVNFFSSQTMGNDFENTSRRIPSYCTLDVQVNIEPCEHFFIFGAIENITDENYAAFAYKGSGYYPNAGRTFKIGINLKL